MRIVNFLKNNFINFLGIFWLIWLNWPFLILGKFGYIRSYEMGDAIYPQMAPLIQMIKSNKFSFWLAAQGAGTDLLGNLNSPIINILLFVLH